MTPITRLFSLVLIAVLIPFSSFSQGQPDPITLPVYNTTPPNPTAALFDKYVNIPVSYSTGTPEITIPIWELKQGDITLPITLSYHASGVKVADVSGWVGLGWTLNAGGLINRNINGLPDEKPPVGYFYHTSIIPQTTVNLYHLNQYYQDLPFLYKVSKGIWDSEPDIFSYNIPNHNGHFAFHVDTIPSSNPTLPFTLTPIIYPFENLKISYTSTYSNALNFRNWKIIDQKGIQYFFDSTESCSPSNSDCSPLKYGATTSWHLSKILSENNRDSLNFSYYAVHSQMMEGQFLQTKKHLYWSAGTGVQTCLPSYSYDECSGQTELKEKNLLKIDGNNCYVKFIEANPFANIDPNITILSRIEIYRKGPEELFKQFLFYYHLSNGRVFLDSLKELASNKEVPSFKFSYNNPEILPEQTSHDIDHWGFYNRINGHAENTSLIPPVFYLHETLFGGNREVDTSKLTLGVLNRINYPEGGNTEFKFEPHDYSMYADSEMVTHYYADLKELSIYRYCDTYPNCATLCPSATKDTSFRLDHDQTITISFVEHHLGVEAEHESYLIILDSLGNTRYDSLGGTSSPTHYTDTIHLFKGKYLVRLRSGICDSTYGQIDYYKSHFVNDTLHLSNIEYGGGIRIKRITYNDGQNQIVKRYKYRNSDGTSTGILVCRKPKYVYFSEITNLDPQSNCNMLVNYFVRVSQNLSSVMNQNGYNVCYTSVEEMSGENRDNGSILYNYSYASDLYYDMYYVLQDYFPFPPTINRAWRRGLLEEKQVFTKDGIQRSKEKNTYSFYTHPVLKKFTTVNGLKIGFVRYGPWEGSCQYKVAPYQIITESPQLISKKVWTFDDNGTNPVIDSTHYYYSDSCMLVHTETWNSAGDCRLKDYKYPIDYNANTASSPESQAIKRMQDVHMYDYVLEEMTSKRISDNDIRLLNSSVLTYNISGSGSSSMVLPKDLYLTKLLTPVQNYSPSSIVNGVFQFNSSLFLKNSTIDNYDNVGRVAQYHKISDVNSSVIWGYNHQFPIAKVLNADTGEISFTSFENNECPGWSNYSPIITSSNPHSGNMIVQVNNGYGPLKLFPINHPSPVSGYKAYVWVKGPPQAYLDIEIDGDWTSHDRKYNSEGNSSDWNLLQVQLTKTQISAVLNQDKSFKVYIGNDGSSQAAYFDDLRVCPSDASMITYTYDPVMGMTSETDENNRLKFYVYDDFGRLNLIKDQDGNILKRINYHYKNQ